MKNLMGDAGYESGVRNKKLKKEYNVNPVIDIKYIWDKEEKYKMRTEIERLNARIDRDYMFNNHFIRGQNKMELMLNLTFIVMLTIAKGHIKNEQENIRSLVA